MGGMGRVRLLGSFPGREGEGVGVFLEDGNAPRVARIVFLPGVETSAREGLWREAARAAEALHHPHVQPPLGLDDVDGRIALAVEHADGETLAEILAVGGRLPHEVAARILRDACVAVHFAHGEGEEQGPILHGWLRPSHLLVGRSGVTLVAGFGAGLARAAADLLPWQSPEQILGGPAAASPASDVHGLGLVLHAALAGENPFEHEPDPDVAMLSRAVPRLEPLGVPAPLAAVVRRALSVKTGDRFPDALAMARAIDEAVPDMAAPSAVAAWSESLFPAGMGMRVLRQRAVDQALAKASEALVARANPVASAVPATPHATAPATPRPTLARPLPALAANRAPRSTPAAPPPRRGRPERRVTDRFPIPPSPPAEIATREAAPEPPRPELHRPEPRAHVPRVQVPLPEPAARPELRPPPRLGFRPAPRPAAHGSVEPRPFPRPVPAPPPPASDDALLAEFTLAAPPFPHAGRRVDPLEAIAIDVFLPDPPPPLRLPVSPRTSAPLARVAIRRG